MTKSTRPERNSNAPVELRESRVQRGSGMFSIAFSGLLGQDALHASYQHPLAGLAMLGVVAAVLAVPVGVRRMMR